MDLQASEWFVVTARLGSITGAAQALGVSRPTLSRRLAGLERDLGLALLHRTTRAVRPTPAGMQLLERLGPLLGQWEAALEAVCHERAVVGGTLRVSVPPLIAPAVADVLQGLIDTHPALEVDLRSEIRHVDLFSEDVDVALRSGRALNPDLVQRVLTRAPVHAYASPAYLATRPPITSAADLRDHALIRDRGGGQPRTHWPTWSGPALPVGGRFVVDDQAVLLHLVRAGRGIGLMTELGLAPDLASGALVRVLPDTVGATLTLRAVWARRTLQPARVGVFVEAVRRAFGDEVS